MTINGPSPTPAAPSVADSLEVIVFGGVALTARALSVATPGLELTFPQWRVLVILGETPSGARVGEVAARIGGTLAATSRMLQRLARRNLVKLATDPADRRATRAELTPEGLAVRSAILAYRRALIDGLASALTTSDETAAFLARVATALASFN